MEYQNIIKTLNVHAIKGLDRNVPSEGNKIIYTRGSRYNIIVDNNKIVDVLDTNKKVITIKKKIINNKLKPIFILDDQNTLLLLKYGLYVFDIILIGKSLTIIDIFYNNGENVMNETWKARLEILATLNLQTSNVIIPTSTPDQIDYKKFQSNVIQFNSYLFLCQLNSPRANYKVSTSG
jgi:hypothetical protein